MSSDEDEFVDATNAGAKRFRSVKEYREKKRLQKLASSGSDRNHSPEPTGAESKNKNDTLSEKDEFTKLLKDTVAQIAYSRIGKVSSSTHRENEEEIPEWRRVSRLISQTLLEKESRMSSDVRYKTHPSHLREAAVKRISGYTTDYLNRKFSNNSSHSH